MSNFDIIADAEIRRLRALVADMELRLENANAGNEAALAEAEEENERLRAELESMKASNGQLQAELTIANDNNKRLRYALYGLPLSIELPH